MIEPFAHDAFRVGEWLVRPDLNRIEGTDSSTRVEPKVMEVLLCLAARPGEVVTRDALLEQVWAGTIVTDDVLTRSISELRKAFDDNPRQASVIETIPKAGYRLIAPVSYLYRGDSAPETAPVLELSVSSPAVSASTYPRFWIGGAVLLVVALLVVLATWLTKTPELSLRTRPLTSFPGNESTPALSPDGNRVVFAWNSGGANWDIYVKLVGEENPLQLTRDEAYEGSPTWSPDGNTVAFMRYTPEGCAIFSVPVIGGPARKRGDCIGNIYPDLTWSPDGAWFAYSYRTAQDEPFSIYLQSSTDQTLRKLTTPPATYWGDHDPVFSPDGQTLSFVRSASEGIQDLYVISLDDSDETRLTHDARNIMGADWRPDGRFLVFASNRGGPMDLWYIGADGGTPMRLVGAGLHPVKPTTARSVTRMAFEQWITDINIWHKTLGDTTAAEPLIGSTQWDLHPQIAPTGDRIAFSSNRSGHYEVWTGDNRGQNLVQLTQFDNTFVGTPRWSPDGRSIAFDARPDGHADVYIIDAAGGTPDRLTTSAADDLAPSWSQDGQWLYFGSSRSGTWEVWKKPVQGGEAVQVTDQGGYAAFESTDGRMLYYTKNDVRGIFRRPVDSGSNEPETLVVPDFPIEDWGHWAVRETGIYFIQRRPSAVAFYSFDTEVITPLFTIQAPIPRMDPAFDVSADESWVAWGQQDHNAVDLMIAEGF